MKNQVSISPAAEKLLSSGELAKRLQLLLDDTEVLRGEPYTYQEVSDFLASRSISLSRSRWAYMLRGEVWRVKDRALIGALAELFEVPAGYLYGGPLPADIESRMKSIVALRAAKVRRYAAKTLGDLAPEALTTITEILRKLES
ncbi:hypothetical protein [Agromyces sp. NPDC058126]|uniref:hypothetical protein n=1 Tax=Agromyces sp. NPDC058126 TaxID=3346350 RepID=UPI0036DD97AD